METGRSAIVRGLYVDLPSLRACADALKQRGLDSTDMSVLLPDGTVTTATSIQFLKSRNQISDYRKTSRASDGPSAGGLTRTLLTFGVPVYNFERLESRMRNGGILLSVRCEASAAERIEEIFVETGAEDISFAPEKRVDVVVCRPISRKVYETTSMEDFPSRAANA